MTVSSPKNTSGAFPTYLGVGSPVGRQTGVIGESYVDTSTNPQTQWYMTRSGWKALGTPGAGGGLVDSVVGGTDISVDPTDPANPVVSFSGVGLTILTLDYAGSDPFDVICFGVPAGYSGATAALGAILTVGSGGIPSGTLLDGNSNPIPDGFVFPASIYVLGSNIYDILALNPYQFGPSGGILWWGSGGGAPIPVPIQGGVITPQLLVSGTVVLAGLPTADPHSGGELWSNSGVVTVSAG